MGTNSTLSRFSLQSEKTEFNKVTINSSKDSVGVIRQFYGCDIDIFESFFLLLLNNANKTIGYVKISQGGITGTVVDIRIILKYAIDSLATKIIIAHNHPSGKLTPSEADERITSKLKSACDIMDIKLLDHIILTSDNYLSFIDEGLL